MASTAKSRATLKKKSFTGKPVSDYANDPFFIKKREKALKFLKKAGLPESFGKKR